MKESEQMGRNLNREKLHLVAVKGGMVAVHVMSSSVQDVQDVQERSSSFRASSKQGVHQDYFVYQDDKFWHGNQSPADLRVEYKCCPYGSQYQTNLPSARTLGPQLLDMVALSPLRLHQNGCPGI